MKITDGTGRGYDVGITPDNHMLVQSFSVAALDHQALIGDAYILTTQLITLSGSAEHGILYAQNTDPVKSMKLDRLRVLFGTASGSALTDIFGRVYSSVGGALSGTLITSGSVAMPSNLSITLRNTPNGVFRMATTSGLTIGGLGYAALIYQTKMSYDESISNVIGPGGSMAISLTLPSGTLALPAVVAVYFYVIDPKNF